MEKSDDVIRCSIEKEVIPKNPVNLKILLSTFEKSSPSASASVSLPGCSRSGRRGPSEDAGGDGEGAVVDESQPSMAEVLTKFRQLEKSGRRRGRGGWKRSSSADRVQGRRSSADDGKPYFWSGDQLDGDSSPPSQTMTLIALFSQMEGRRRGGRRSFARTETEQRQAAAAKRNSREVSVTFQGHPTAHESEEMVEMPEEGLVQTLLTQWKALEKPSAKKKKTWTPPQVKVSRQSDIGQRKSQTNTGAASASASSSSSYHQKTPTASCNASTPPKTTVAPKKTTETPQKISHKTTAAVEPYTRASGNKQNSQTANVQLKDAAGSDIGGVGGVGGGGGGGGVGGVGGGGGGVGGGGGGREEPAAPMEGIARNITEKFHWMELKNTNSQTLPRNKSFKWEVKESGQLGGRSINGVNRMDSPHQPGLTFDLAKTLTPPSSPNFDHFDQQRKSEFFNRQPDITVEQSNRKTTEGWKDEFPFPCQTKNLLQRYEALLAHN